MDTTPRPNTTTPARRGRPPRDWTAIDETLMALPAPLPYGALSALAAQLGVPASTIYARLQARRGTAPRPVGARALRRSGPRAGTGVAAPARAAVSIAAASTPARPAGLDPTCCPAPGCPGVRTILADPRQMPTLPVGPSLVAQAGSLGMCDHTPPHYSWVGAAGAEVLDLEGDPG